ncbi:MAG: hypothetical protein HC899_14020 [Leptolyngbyaceae cyanobacterium SM1_4_3]|nr:hypothetical protein [Leptolyngbyaceae cyanobacterium SM1_4_3]NJN90699.1 hypothetical protein [Leptolyngbyaceae cyanobacterium SL_5_14]
MLTTKIRQLLILSMVLVLGLTAVSCTIPYTEDPYSNPSAKDPYATSQGEPANSPVA